MDAANLTPVPLSPTHPPRPTVPYLPNELLLLILDNCKSSDLFTARLVSLTTLITERDEAATTLRDTEREKRPYLRHYRDFRRSISSTKITKATWYPAPPTEVYRNPTAPLPASSSSLPLPLLELSLRAVRRGGLGGRLKATLITVGGATERPGNA
ncbi:hypothetical protein BDK51DRAFT_39186 [Blyttiomyces helicus]|uniref:F-box domain-containing protein n=1 Tax=Blyttiomyces helicus TaxID=388810 RepID=A0A4P9W9C2_9FUNG|nr:hypothetical protein BDK51DRAFT_39186 [Blyttiomyces helicus]|eukprot:RKO88994.1 hypothetical protein BDK51DRAFT_39186 [Blyttiomyces helicus]